MTNQNDNFNKLNISEDINEVEEEFVEEELTDEKFDAAKEEEELSDLNFDDNELNVFDSKYSGEILFKSIMNNYKVFTPEEEKDIFTRLMKAKKEKNTELYKELFDEISLHNIRLVFAYANKRSVSCHTLSNEDLVVEGYLGLRSAIEKFDIKKGYKFSTYASWWVRQSINRAISNDDLAIRIPVHAYEFKYKWDHMTEEEREEYRKTFKSAFFKEPENLYDLIASAEHAASLNQTVSEDEGDETELLDFLTDSNANVEDIVINSNGVMRQKIEKLIDEYSMHAAKLGYLDRKLAVARYRDILRRRFGFDTGTPETLDSIGKSYNVSRERIRQIEARFIYHLRHSFKYMTKDIKNLMDDMRTEEGELKNRQRMYQYYRILEQKEEAEKRECAYTDNLSNKKEKQKKRRKPKLAQDSDAAIDL